MNDKEPIREFDFFRSFEKPKNINDLPKPNKLKEKIKDSTKELIDNTNIKIENSKKEIELKQEIILSSEDKKLMKKMFAICIVGFSVCYLYYDSFTKMNEISQILQTEQAYINKNIDDFTVKSITNTFVVKNFNECSKMLKGSKADTDNQCELYLLNLVDTAPKEMQLDKKAVSQSLEEFNKLSTISPEASLKTDKIANDIKLVKIMKFFSSD